MASRKLRTKVSHPRSVSHYSKHAPLGYNHIYQRALAWAPDILPVAIARWTDGVKNIRPLDLRQVRSGVYHIGNTINAGHFRPFWFYPGRGVLHVGDDAVRPKTRHGLRDATSSF